MSADPADLAVRHFIYRRFAQRGRPPSLDETAAAFSLSRQQAEAVFLRLNEGHFIFLDPDGSGVRMANPFSGVQTDYVVETPSMTCYANCAWDALGVPAILASDGWTRTRCAESDEPLEFGIRRGRLGGAGPIISQTADGICSASPLRWDRMRRSSPGALAAERSLGSRSGRGGWKAPADGSILCSRFRAGMTTWWIPETRFTTSGRKRILNPGWSVKSGRAGSFSQWSRPGSWPRPGIMTG